jgi:hypothetical protein
VSTAVLIAAIVAAGAVCPLTMWIQGRRGRAAGCPPRRERESPATLDELRRRRAEVDALIAEHHAAEAFPEARPRT